MTYVIVRPVTTVLGIICTLAGVYGDGEMRYDRFYPYSALINGVVQFWALYCLVLMYQARRETRRVRIGFRIRFRSKIRPRPQRQSLLSDHASSTLVNGVCAVLGAPVSMRRLPLRWPVSLCPGWLQLSATRMQHRPQQIRCRGELSNSMCGPVSHVCLVDIGLGW